LFDTIGPLGTSVMIEKFAISAARYRANFSI
jgi:hypothetical protein